MKESDTGQEPNSVTGSDEYTELDQERRSTSTTQKPDLSDRKEVTYVEPDAREKLGLLDRVIDGMNRLELNATANPYVEKVRNAIDSVRLSLQKDATGGEGKLFADFKASEEGKKSFPQGKDKFNEQELKSINTAFDAYKNNNPQKPRSTTEAIGAAFKQFGKSTLGFVITVGVQVGNSVIKTGALAFNTVKLGVMATAALAGSELAGRHLKEEAANLRKDFKSTVISYINTFAVATGIGALVGAKAGILYSAGQAVNSLADSTGKLMGLTAAQVEEAALMKKGTALTAELNKTEFYKKTASIMELRDPEMYKKLVALRANHIDKEGVSFEERRAAAVVEKEILETFRNNQNTMLGMVPRLVKSTVAKLSSDKPLTPEKIGEAKTKDLGPKVAVNKDSLGNSAFHAVTFGAFKSFEARQEEGHKKIDHHTKEFKDYLKMRTELGSKGHDTLSTDDRHKYLNLYRKFAKTSFSKEM